MSDGTTNLAGASGVKIDPESFWSPQDVVFHLRIGEGAQVHARQSGKLKFRMVGRQGVDQHVVYRGKDLIDWLTGSGLG